MTQLVWFQRDLRIQDYEARRFSGTLLTWRKSLACSPKIVAMVGFTLRSKAMRRHKSVVNPKPEKPTWRVTAGTRIAVTSSSPRWLRSYEFETYSLLLAVKPTGQGDNHKLKAMHDVRHVQN